MSERLLTAVDLEKSMHAAQAELEQLAAGGMMTWVLPAGSHRLPAGMQFGAAGRTLRLTGVGTTLMFDHGEDESGDAALTLIGAQVTVEGVCLNSRAADQVTGLRVRADEAARLKGLQVSALRGGQVTGLDVEARRIDLQGLVLAGLTADDALTAIRAQALAHLSAKDIRLDALRGRQVRGFALDTPAGVAADISIKRLHAADGRPLPFDLSNTTMMDITGLTVERRLAGPNLQGALLAAQDALAVTPVGAEEIWEMPAGDHPFSQAMQLGREDVALTLRSPAAPCVWSFENAAGDFTALTLAGRALSVDNLVLAARSSGSLTALRMTAGDQAQVDDLQLRELQGTAVVGLDLEAAAAAVTDLHIDRADADTGSAYGMRVRSQTVSLRRIHIERLHAGQTACGVFVRAAAGLTAAALRLEEISGARALGTDLYVQDPDGELVLLDAVARRVAAPVDGIAAVGLLALSAGDSELRGISAGQISGARAAGVIAAAGGQLDWLAGDIRNVRGLAGGAAGARVVADESDQALRVADVRIEAISGTAVGTDARPPSSWQNWWQSARSDGAEPAPWPEEAGHREDVAGLHIACFVAESVQWAAADPGAVLVQDTILRRISGTALQIDGGLRDVALFCTEAWTALRGGWMDGERVHLAQLTWHRHHTGLAFGPCTLALTCSLVTGIVQGAGVVPAGETVLALDQSTEAYVQGAPDYFLQPPDPLPYVISGPAGIPPAMHSGEPADDVPVDLRLQADHELVVKPPRGAAFIGAHEPDRPPGCDLRDPLPPAPPPAPPEISPSPVVDYRARDARSLLALMLDRAGVSMPDWKERNPADQVTMLLELLAHEMDKLAYRQEVAVSEGYLGTALSRRSVEDHARLVDYIADPGLSATTLLQFSIDDAGLRALNMSPTQTLAIPADTVVVNSDARDDVSTIFATESPLRVDPQLHERYLRLNEPIAKGSVSAVLKGDLIERGAGSQPDRLRIAPGRWLVFASRDPNDPPHVVQVVAVELETDATRITWDPRRPAPTAYLPETTTVHANVVPAHHGVPLTPMSATMSPGAIPESVDILNPWRRQMTMQLNNEDGALHELELPLHPVSIQARGWPLPGDELRPGEPQIEVWIDGEPWHRVEHLALAGRQEECFALRPGRGGGSAIRFGDGLNGARLPRRSLTVELRMRVGLGRTGNVGPGALTRILGFGSGGDIARILPYTEDRDALIAQHLRVSNVVAAVGGRDPEPLEHIRYWAPRSVRDNLSAVALADYEYLLEALPEVAAARARLVDVGLRRVVRVTLLLKDEDTLVRAELGAQSDAERLRRWALVRHHLESIRLLGFDVELVPPVFVPLDLDIVVDAHPWAAAERLRQRVIQALAADGGLFDPDVSGLGRDVYLDRIHQAVLAVDGVAALRMQRLRRLEPGARDFVGQGRLPVASHEVAVLRNPYGSGADGLLTVAVCGGML